MYYSGKGVTQSYAKALEWYSRAANQGEAVGQYNMGISYDQGVALPQDFEKAVEWYQKAAALGDADAIGRISYDGIGARQQIVCAVEAAHQQAVLA